eukprot:1118460-Alexandrium_andersonii.AAC.1
MSASLVGSEMCIRDRDMSPSVRRLASSGRARRIINCVCSSGVTGVCMGCLLYTSDAADDM